MGAHYRKLWAVGLGFALLGCEDFTDLNVVNENNPETERTLATPADLEALIGGTFLTYWDGTQHRSPFGSLSVMADEGSVSWGNWGMNDNGFEPRRAYNNSSTYRYRFVNQTPWDNMYGALSAAADGLIAINEGVEIGAGGEDNPRAIAFAKFVQGVSLGWLALQFDQAIIFDETVDLLAAVAGDFEFVPYPQVMTAALTKMDEAIALATANTFTLKSDWIGGLALTNTEFVQVMHSFKARLLTHVARSPAEAANINWQAVIDEVNAGITDDLVLVGDPGNTWWSVWTWRATEAETWMRADYKSFGYTDTSGEYINWLSTPVADRQEFEMLTPDLRIWGCGIDGDLGGQCRSVDGSTSRNARLNPDEQLGQAGDQEPGLYFRFFGSSPFSSNRGTFVFSMYHHWRWEDVFEEREGPLRHILTEEMDLLRAEAFIQLGNLAAARDIINATRVPAGLVAVDVDGAPCPAVLDGQAGRRLCDLMDQLIYEKRMETMNTNSGGAYFERRRWGNPASTSSHHRGLVEGTPHQFPVAGTELEVLQLPTYTFGGVGNEGVPGPNIGIEGMSRMTARYEDFYTFEPGMTLKEKLAFIEEHFRDKGSDLLTRYH